MHVNQNVYLEIVVVFAERIQHCLSNLNQSAITAVSQITVCGCMRPAMSIYAARKRSP